MAEKLFDDRVAAGDYEEFATGSELGSRVAAVGGQFRERSKHVELRDGSGGLAQAGGFCGDARAQVDEKLALDVEDALVGRQFAAPTSQPVFGTHG